MKEGPAVKGKGVLGFLEQYGKSFAWIIQVLIAAAVGVVGYYAYQLNKNQFNFQQETLSLETIREFTSEARSPDQKY